MDMQGQDLPVPLHNGDIKHTDMRLFRSKCDKNSFERLFVQPIDLTSPVQDLLGYRELCEFRVSELHGLESSNLNQPVRFSDEDSVYPSYIVRVWSVASQRYLCILAHSAAVYARGMFGANGQFRMICRGPDIVVFQSTLNDVHYLGVRGGEIVGNATGGEDSEFHVQEDKEGFWSFDCLATKGLMLGVRDNGNIINPAQVKCNSTSAKFVVQKEALDLVT